MRRLILAVTALGFLAGSLPAVAAEMPAQVGATAKPAVVKHKRYVKRHHHKHFAKRHHHRLAMHKKHHRLAAHKRHHQHARFHKNQKKLVQKS